MVPKGTSADVVDYVKQEVAKMEWQIIVSRLEQDKDCFPILVGNIKKWGHRTKVTVLHPNSDIVDGIKVRVEPIATEMAKTNRDWEFVRRRPNQALIMGIGMECFGKEFIVDLGAPVGAAGNETEMVCEATNE